MQLKGQIIAGNALTGKIAATPAHDNRIANVVGTVSKKE